MDSKWTPGPWKVGVCSTPPHAPGVFANGLLVASAPTYPREPAEGRANARLIATAPDLYFALDVLVRWAEGAGKPQLDGGRALAFASDLEGAKQILAFARGGEDQ